MPVVGFRKEFIPPKAVSAMERSTRIDSPFNGKSRMQVESDGSLRQNGIREESSGVRTHMGFLPPPDVSGWDWKMEPGRKSHADFVNGSSNLVSRVGGENFARSIMPRSVSLVTDSVDAALTPKTGLMPDVSSLAGVPTRNDRRFGHDIAAKEIESETTSNFETVGWKMDIGHEDAYVRPLKTESDDSARVLNDKYDNCPSSTKAVETSEDSRLLENRPIIGKPDETKDSDMRQDSCLVDFKSLSCDIESGDSKKSQRPKTPDSLRPLARLLHDIGLELVRQLVYKDLIEIQGGKEVQDRLDDGDNNQLARLTEAHSKLCAKCESFRMPTYSCRCGFKCESTNVMALHREFGQTSDQFAHVCCSCEEFRSKWPSQFVAHMETVHDAKARIQKKLAPHVCFFCAYEHKNWMKIELHMSKCANKFSLSSNLQPQPADCDIPVLYKPGQIQPRIYPMNPPPVPSLPGRFPAPPLAAATVVVTPPAVATPSQPPPPINVAATSAQSTSSVMEIDGQLYSLVNHNGKVLLTSLRSQIGSASSAGAGAAASSSAAVIPSTSGTRKAPFPPPTARPPKPALEPIKMAIPVHRETCEICGAVVSSREALWTHFRDVHRVELSRTSMREQEPWMKCTFCTTRFWTYQGLARHSSSHHNRNIAPLPQAMNASSSSSSRSTRCYLCGHSQTSNPLNHFSTFHNITLLDMYQSRQCCMCNRRLKQSRAFEEHMIVQHRDIFANSEVLHTVIQALSTAHFLKTEDGGILQRPPLMVQQLQQNVSVAGTTPGTHSSTKSVSGTKGVVSSTSVVSVLSRTMSGSIGTSGSGTRTVSSANTVPVTKTTFGANMTSATRSGSWPGYVPNSRTFSHSNNTFSGTKVSPSSAASMRNISATRNVSITGFVSGGKLTSPYVRSPAGFSKTTTSTTQGFVKPGPRPQEFKRPKLPDSADRVKQFEPSSSTAKKTVDDTQKDFSKLYTELSDIGRPILRSMRLKLAHGDCTDTLKRPADFSEQGSIVEANCGADSKPDIPAQKVPRLDGTGDRAQGIPCRSDNPSTPVTLSGPGRVPELANNVMGYVPTSKDL